MDCSFAVFDRVEHSFSPLLWDRFSIAFGFLLFKASLKFADGLEGAGSFAKGRENAGEILKLFTCRGSGTLNVFL